MDFNITMDDLPLVERDRVLALYAACKRIREASACYGGQQEAIRDAAALLIDMEQPSVPSDNN